MSREIPQHIIVESYLYAGTASHVASLLNQFYAGCRRITPRELLDRWAAEVEVNTPLRHLGDRPYMGFEQCDKTTMVRRLVSEREPPSFAHGKTRSEHAGSSS